MYPASFVTANAVLVYRAPRKMEIPLADAVCEPYDEPKTIFAIEGFGCFFVDLSVDSQYLERNSRVQQFGD